MARNLQNLQNPEPESEIFAPFGWLSKLGSLFVYPKCKVPYYIKDPKRDPNFDNHPYENIQAGMARTGII